MAVSMNEIVERWQLQSEIKKIYRQKYRDLVRKEEPAGENLDAIARRFEVETSPLRARLLEMESSELVSRAMDMGIVVADLAPLRFGSPLWRREAGCQYLSAEGKQTVERAIRAARRERMKWAVAWIAPVTGLIGALTGLVAIWLRTR